MRENTTKGLICLRDDYEIEYKIALITYTEREDESFTYTFRPYYNVIDLLQPPVFQGIPGLNLDLKRECYVRENRIPVFISERTPGKNREDLWELLEAVGMEYLDPLEWLIRTDMRYPGDRFYVRRYSPQDDSRCVRLGNENQAERASTYSRYLLDLICQGHDVRAEFYQIDDSNRKEYYHLLMTMYRKEADYLKNKRIEGIRQSAACGNYRGRVRIQIDEVKAEEVFGLFEKNKISEEEALKRLEISRATFYRRLREFRKGEGN